MPDAETTSRARVAAFEPKLMVRSLYKIFGDHPEAVLPFAQAGMGKDELLAKHDHVLGLRDVNIDIASGAITVVMGLSGSGKSTLVRHFNRLIEPTAGEILLDGEDVLAFEKHRLRELRRTQMSMVFQKFALFPHRTVLENAALALRVRGRPPAEIETQATYWLDQVGLASYRDYYPNQLSGGMQQRVGLARALTSNAEIMLMDEAFSALDPVIRTEMQDRLLALQRELRKTIVFISHDLDEALKLADHLVILKDGTVVQADEPQQILLHPGDPYVEEFVKDINRARVIRVRSVMRPDRTTPAGLDEAVDYDDTLEEVIAVAGGDTARNFVVTREGRPVGWLKMKDVVRALVPRMASSDDDG